MRRVRVKLFFATCILVLMHFGAQLTPATADGVPLTIDGVINCAHPDNAITTTCRGEAPPPPPAPAPPPPAPSSSAGESAPGVPLTINGVINCAHPDNAITTTCRGEAPPPPANTPPVTTEAAPPGTTITYSGNTAINCALPENKDNNICLPMTNSDGSINCAQADNAITTTCWERAQTLKQFGATETEVNCSLDRFKEYPVCTGIKPQAVIDYEKSQETSSKLPLSNTRCAEPAFINTEECKNPVVPIIEDQKKTETPIPPATTPAESAESTQTTEPEVKPEITGSIDLKSRSSKTTVLSVNLDTSKVQVRVIATKKGAPSITRELTTDANGKKTVKFGKNLKGYTVRIVVDGEVVDQTKI